MENPLPEKRVTLTVLFDIVLMIIVFLPCALCFLIGKPFKRGFFCDDESIAHPYKDSTISDAELVVIGVLIPSICLICSELFIYFYRRRKSLPPVRRSRFRCLKWSVNRCFAEMYINVGVFLFGAAACQSTTDIMKYSLGRLRPHFLAACQPRWEGFNCTDAEGFMRYVEDFECTGDPDIIQEARLSHPSGHASLSAYCMLYLALYIQRKLTWRGSNLLKRAMQIGVIYVSLYTGMSRISDYKHHWSDVLSGFCIGTLFALISVFFVSGLFKTTVLATGKAKQPRLTFSLNETNAYNDDVGIRDSHNMSDT